MAEIIKDKRHLILHFDVNKTLIMVDPAGNKTMEDVLGDIICETIYGVSNETEWVAQTVELAVENPQPKLWKSYHQHLEDLYPDDRAMRKKLKSQFLKEGQLGYKYRPILQKLIEKMRIQNEDYHFIVPAFFEMMKFLKENSVNFTIIFRTFGCDLNEIIGEFNAFCEGRHLGYPGVKFDGSDGYQDHRVHSNLYRGWIKREQEIITLGFPESIHCSHEYIYKIIKARALNGKTLAIQDHYQWWASNKEHFSSGKPLILDFDDPEIGQIFFDDNVNIEQYLQCQKMILDIRTIDGKSIPCVKVLNKNIVKVEPLLVIENPRYYIEKVLECLKNQHFLQV